MRKTAFVTGATGFLGLNLIKQLSEENWEITTYSLPGSKNKYLSAFSTLDIEGDLSDLDRLKASIPKNVDCIFHVAGNTSMWNKHADQQFQDNVIGTKNIIDAARYNNAKKLVYTSSISAYGYHATSITEETPSNAMTCKMNYNKTKFLAELAVKRAAKDGLFCVILNPINILGPYDISNWTKQLIKPIYEDTLLAIPPGKAMWCHVEDIVDAHINAYNYGRNGENYLLGGAEGSFHDVVQEVQKQLNKSRRYMIQPKFVLRIVYLLSTFKSFIDKKEPLLTYPKFKRATGAITCDDSKARKELMYRRSPLSKSINDTCQWLKQEHIIKGA